MKSGRKSQILDRESKLWGAVTKIGVLVAIFLITDALKDRRTFYFRGRIF